MGRGRGYHLLTLLGLSLLIYALKENRKVIINNVIWSLKALELSIWTEKTIRSEEKVYLFSKIRGVKPFAFFDS
jgi:hypothetical protein